MVCVLWCHFTENCLDLRPKHCLKKKGLDSKFKTDKYWRVDRFHPFFHGKLESAWYQEWRDDNCQEKKTSHCDDTGQKSVILSHNITRILWPSSGNALRRHIRLCKRNCPYLWAFIPAYDHFVNTRIYCRTRPCTGHAGHALGHGLKLFHRLNVAYTNMQFRSNLICLRTIPYCTV